MPRIKESFIDQLLQHAAVEDVVAQFVDLKRSGSSLKGLSPFTDEKTPSFMVSPAKQIFKCFSSGHGGGVVKFLMTKEGLSYPDAIKWLADYYHQEVEYEEVTEQQQEEIATRETSIDLNDHAATLYQDQLLNLPPEHPVAKLIAERFTEEEVIQWQIGWAPDDAKFITSRVVERGKAKAAQEAGLIAQKNGSYYDAFRGRITFPIFNRSGRVVGFSARDPFYRKGESKYPKYINTRDTPAFNKSAVLYGLNFAAAEIIKQGCFYLVEGQPDVIAMHRVGLTNTVAALGTSLTALHCKQLGRLAPHGVLVMDGDKAGLNALTKPGGQIETLLANGMRASIVMLPDDQDPEEFITHELNQENELVHE